MKEYLATHQEVCYADQYSVYNNKPQAVFIMGGINDLITGADLEWLHQHMSMTHQSLAKFIEL